MITWRPLGPDDVPLLKEWLEQPHVARWWNHDTSVEAVAKDFSAGEAEGSADLIALLDGRPLGLVQRSRLSHHADYTAELEAITPVPRAAITIDYFIGDRGNVGVGLGPEMIRSVVEYTWQDQPDIETIIVAVPVANRASWRALEKAGFRQTGEGEMTPDNPVDDRLHYIYRSERPNTHT